MTQTIQKNWLVKTGDFLFKWRNYLFPVIILCLFIPFHPPHSYFGLAWIEEAKDIVALFLIVSGLAFRSATIGWAYIKRGGLNKQVYADKLVREGFFGFCRNPLYVGNILVYMGIFILHGHLFVMAAGISLYAFIYIAIIAAEEYYLRKKFGQEYQDYCSEVARWVPDFSKYKECTNGMSFSVKRAVFKDYTTIFNAIFAIAVIEMTEHFTSGMQIPEPMLLLILSLFCMATFAFLCVAYVKKTGKVKVR